MRLSSCFKMSIKSLLYSPLRGFLAMLGCMIGTASVVILLSSGNLATQKAMDLFKSLGTNQMALSFYPIKQSEDDSQHVRSEVLLNMKSVIPGIKLMAPYITANVQVSYQRVNFNSNVIGSNPELFKIIKINLSKGRFFSSLDKDDKLCILGSNLVAKLKNINPLGLRVKLGKSIFTIIGIADTWPENGFFSGDINDSIIIPLNLTRLITSTMPSIHDVIMDLEDTADIDFTKGVVSNYFTKYLPGYNLTIQSAKEMIKNMSAQRDTFTLLLAFIGGVSLFVAGIGIMNIMLASISERRHEIGLRLAIGAQPMDIQLMFLTEAIILAIIGGGIGVLIGILTTYFIALFSGWTFTVFLFPPFIGFTFSVLISMFFGFYPAYLASKLNPIQALRAS